MIAVVGSNGWGLGVALASPAAWRSASQHQKATRQLALGSGSQAGGEVLECRLGFRLLLTREVYSLPGEKCLELGGDLETFCRCALRGKLEDPRAVRVEPARLPAVCCNPLVRTSP